MNPKPDLFFRRATLAALLLCRALVAVTVSVSAQDAAPANPPAANDATTPTSPLTDLRMPEGALPLTTPKFVAAYSKLLGSIAQKSNQEATGTELWAWAGKPAEAPDIIDAVARKLRRADYTYTPGQPQKTATSTITFFTAKSADKSLLGAWRVAQDGLFLGWCVLKPGTGGAATPPPQPDAPAQPVTPPQPATGQTTPKEDAFTTVSRVTGIVMRMGPSRVTSANNIKFLTRMLKKGIGETQGIGPVEALTWQGPAVDAVTIKSDKKDILDALQKVGYTYQEGATQTEPGDATYTYFTAQGKQQNLQGVWRFDPENHTFILTWAPATGTAALEGVPSVLTGIALPNDGQAATTEALVNVLTTLLQRPASADQKKVSNVEVFEWKGNNYKPDQADTIKSAVMDRLQKIGFTADAATPDTGTAMTYFRAHNGAKAIQGLWRKSDTGLILAWGALGDAGQ